MGTGSSPGPLGGSRTHARLDGAPNLPEVAELGELPQTIAELASPLADWCTVYLLGGEGQASAAVAVAGEEPHAVAFAEALMARYPRPLPSGPVDDVMRSRQITLLRPGDGEPVDDAGFDGQYRELRGRVPFGSSIVAPIVVRDEVAGALVLRAVGSADGLGERHLGIAEALAASAGLLVEHAHLAVSDREGMQLRDDLLSIASHELRAPLSAIFGFAARLRRLPDSDLDAESRDAVDIIYRGAQRMNRTIALLLDVTRFERPGKVELDQNAFDLDELVEEELRSLEIRHPQVDVTRSMPESPVEVVSDEAAVAEVIANLLENAVKYGGAPPHLIVHVDADEGRANFRVTDNGDGIAPDVRERIFERFSRGPERASAKGLGLGLYISNQIATALGGQLAFEAAPGGGTTFSFGLPLSPDVTVS